GDLRRRPGVAHQRGGAAGPGRRGRPTAAALRTACDRPCSRTLHPRRAGNRTVTTPRIRYGGDYNPEQWPHEVWEEDYAAFDLASIDTLTIGVFGWSHIQPAEDRYDFTMLDAIVQRAVAGGRSIVLATPTGG